MRSTYLLLGVFVFGALIFAIIMVQSALGAVQSNTANMTTGIGNSVSAMKNATTNTTANTSSNNNVTAASGNNGHIYRGGAAAGSGGE
jgi:hypothetical protein